MPDFCLAGDRRNLTHLPILQGVDDTALTDVRVTNEANRNLFLVRMELRKLAKELNERAFAKRMVWGCMESKSGVPGCKILYVSCLETIESVKCWS